MFEAFEFGPFIFWTHEIFLLLGFVLSTEFFMRLAQSANLSISHFKDRAWQYLLAFLVGGRGFAILAEYRVYLHDPLRVFMINDGNFSLLGCSIGIAALLSYATRESRTTFLQWLDVLVPATSFGLVFDWIGRFAAGQQYGSPTDVPWAVTYDAINVRYTVPVHPVQLYYAFFFFILTFVLLIVRKHATRAGAETLVGIACAACAAMLFENFRGDFGILVFATSLDLFLLLILFLGLATIALVELKMSDRQLIIYEGGMAALFGVYFVIRPWIGLATHELRFSQLLAVLALFSAVVYVVVHRRRYPHL